MIPQSSGKNTRAILLFLKEQGREDLFSEIEHRFGVSSATLLDEHGFRELLLRAVDEQEVWSVSCFFVLRPFRRQGISVALLKAALALARRQGARVVEGYPVVPPGPSLPDVFLWTGAPQAFRRAGFRTVARRSRSRPIVRHLLPRGG